MGAISNPAGDVGFRRIVVFTASGSYIKPAGLRRIKIVRVFGSGGGGGGVTATANDVWGGSGGAGSQGEGPIFIEASALLSTTTVTVPAGGAGGAGGVAGVAGGTASFGTHASATGGGAGAGSAGSTSGGDGATGVTVAGGLKRFFVNIFGLSGSFAAPDSNGSPGTLYSGLGSGGRGGASIARLGAAGAPGLIEIEEYY